MVSTAHPSRSPSQPRPTGIDDAAPSGATSFDELVLLAQDEERAGHREAARVAYEQALYRARTPDEAAQLSSVMRWIARTHHVDGNAEAARDCLEAALAMAEIRHDDAAAGHAMNVQAVVSWQRGDLDDAERLYLLARARAIRAGDAKLAAMTAQNLGVLANIRGDFAVAEQQYTASLAEYRSLGLTTDVCIALNNLGLLYIAQQQWVRAEQVLLEGVQISELSGDPMTRTQLDINLAELWVRRGEFGRAQGAVRKALEAAGQTGDASAVGKATKLLGVIARETGNFDEADRHFQQADEVATARGELLLQAEVARERADLARRMGRNREVLQQLNRSHRLFTILRAQPDLSDVDERVSSLEQEFVHVARRWGESIEAKDRYTQGHCQRVAELACAIAAKSGLDANSMFWFRIGALLHDVGKLVIPQEVLNKPGKLDEQEWQLMRSHTTAGVEMLADIEFPWDVRPMVESHHERWDGKGYPHAIAGNDIPLIARILTIADVYDALTSVRSYKRAHSHEDAMVILRKDVGTMFDPLVFSWFEEIAVDWPARVAHLMQDNEPPGDSIAEPGTAAALVTAPVVSLQPGDPLDDLTGVPLRRALRETAEQLLVARCTTGRPVSLLVIDVDHFKLVNDTFGHLQGDRVLKSVTGCIRTAIRPSDYVARYAGDEFVVLLPGTRLEDACVVAERIRATMATSQIDAAGALAGVMTVTLSIGAACAPLHGETFEALFGAADTALFGAKRGGRNAVTSAARTGAGVQDRLLDCFVGRSAERARLGKLLASASSGDARVVVVRGEAGVGKSALLKQLGPDVAIRSGAILHGQCIEADVGMPYAPWAEIVLSAHRAALVPNRSWRELSRLVPELAAHVESGARGASRANVAEARHQESGGAEGSYGGSQRALLEELEEFLSIAALTRPIVVVLDDMQWADPASWDALEFLLVRIREERLLVCLSVRPEDLGEPSAARLRRLSRSERCSDLTMTRLPRTDLEHMVRATLGGQVPDRTLLAYIAQQSEGNPFFAVQTLRALVEDGALRSDADRWQFTPPDDALLPQAIGDLLSRRIERLDRSRRDVLALAAVLGRDFDPSVLVAAFQGDESNVHDALDDGLLSGVLSSGGTTKATLTFTHALLMRALLRGVNPLRLRAMHERVARTCESLPAGDSATVAVHYNLAGCATDAFRTATDAGSQAQTVYAYESAVKFYRMARRHAADEAATVETEWRLAQVEELAGHLDEAERQCNAVLASDQSHIRIRKLAPAARRMRERVRLQRGVPANEVLLVCGTLLTEARHDGDAEDEAAVLIMMSTLQQRLGNMSAAERDAISAVHAADATGKHAVQADAVMRLGSVLLTSSPAEAVPHYRRAYDMFTRLNDRYGQLRAQINIGSACDRAGNNPAAEASYVAALELGRAIHATDYTGVASLNLGVLLLKAGQLADARQRISDALQLFTSIGHEPYRLGSLYNLAHVARAGHDAVGALELYAASIALSRSMSQVDVLLGALAGAGLAEVDLQAWRGAEAHFDEAQALIQSRETWWFQGRELWEALRVKLTMRERGRDHALPMLLEALERADECDAYAALWLGADCVEVLATTDARAAATVRRLSDRARAHGYAALLSVFSAIDPTQ